MPDNKFQPNTNVVFLLDQYTRRAATHIPYDALSKHCIILTDIRELSEIYFGYTFIFCEPSVPCMVTRELLIQILKNSGVVPYLIASDERVGSLFDDIVKVEYVDYSKLDWNLLYAVINSDYAMLESYTLQERQVSEFSRLLPEVPANVRESLDRMYRSYIFLCDENKSLRNKVHDQETSISTYKHVYKLLQKATTGLKDLYKKVESEKNMLVAMLSKNCDEQFCGLYTERPRVLYVKSIGHLPGVDNLLLTLHTVLTTQYRVSCKIVKLMDSSSALGMRYVPNVYKPLPEQYSTADVLDNNFLMSIGSYTMLFGMLMLNRSGLNTLIIHDCRGSFEYAIEDSLIDLKLHEVPGDYAVLAEYPNILSSISSADYIWDFNAIYSKTGTQSTKLANHPTVTSIASKLL